MKGKVVLLAGKLLCCAAGIGSGVIMMMTEGDVGHTYGERSAKAAFGADFYTEIYGATRNAANNTATLISTVNSYSKIFFYAGLILLILSLFMAFHSIWSFQKASQDEKILQCLMNLSGNGNAPIVNAPAPVVPQEQIYGWHCPNCGKMNSADITQCDCGCRKI